MKAPRLRIIVLLSLSALIFLAACGPDEKPTPTTIPSTPTIAASSTPIGTATNTSTPTSTSTSTSTPTVTSTPTETPQPTFVSIPGPQPTTLVKKDVPEARQKYEEALARWRSQNVIEYDLVVRNNSTAPFAGLWTLHVNGPQIDVLSYSTSDVITPTTPPDFMVGDALRFMTVDGLFSSVETRLTADDFGSALETRVDYLAKFDPELGYPISVEIRPKPNNKGQDLASSTTIERLTILKRNAALPVPPTATLSPPPPSPPANTALPASPSPAVPITSPNATAVVTAVPRSQGSATGLPSGTASATPISTPKPSP
jgi:hypothetical protein